MINIFAWLIFGALAGWITSQLVKPVPVGTPLISVIAGVMGALTGGFVVLIFDTTPLSDLNVWAVCVALLGALVMITLVRLAFR